MQGVIPRHNLSTVLAQITSGQDIVFDFSRTPFQDLTAAELQKIFQAFSYFNYPFVLKLNQCTFNQPSDSLWQEFRLGISTSAIKSFELVKSDLSDERLMDVSKSLLRNHHMTMIIIDARTVIPVSIQKLLMEHPTAKCMVNGLLLSEKRFLVSPLFFNQNKNNKNDDQQDVINVQRKILGQK